MRSSACLLKISCLLLLLLINFNGGKAFSQQGAPEVVAHFPNVDERFKGEFIVIFDQNIMRDAGIVEDTPWLSISPPLRGIETVGSNYIRLQSSTPISSSPKSYAIELTKGITSLDGKALVPTKPFIVSNFSFTSRGLSPYTLNDKGKTKLVMRFNTMPDIESLKQHLVLLDGNKNKIEHAVESHSLSNSVRIDFSADAVLPVSLKVKKGLKTKPGHHTLNRDEAYHFPSDTPLTLKQVSWRNERAYQKVIDLQFSEVVSSKSLKPFMYIQNPNTKERFKFDLLEGRSDRHTAVVKGEFNHLKSLEVVIQPGVMGDKLGRINTLTNRTIKTKTKALQIERHYWDSRGIKGAVLKLRLNATVDIKRFEKALRVEPPIANLSVRLTDRRYVEISGDWQQSHAYKVFLAKGLSDSTGGYMLNAELKHTLSKAPKVSGIAFEYRDKLFFPLRHRGKINLKSRNYTSAGIKVHKLLPNNLPHALDLVDQSNSSSNQYYGNQKDLLRDYSVFLGTQHVDIEQIHDTLVKTPVDIESLLPDGEYGVYVLEMNGHRKVVLWTNLGVLGNWDKEKMVFFVHDLFSLEPVPHASITVYSSKNQALATLTTNSEGLARLSSFDASLGQPHVAVIKTKSDTSFLNLKPKKDRLDHAQRSIPMHTENIYESFLYADRNLYRPGEQMHLRWVVRDTSGATPANMPVVLKVFNSKNQVVFSEALSLSDIGTGGFTVDTRKDYLTGNYRLELRLPTSNTHIAKHSVQIEEFIPNRMRATIQLSEGAWDAKTNETITVVAEHLFGGVAAKRPVEAQVILQPATIRDPRWESYRFLNDSKTNTVVNSLGTALTDEEGKADFKYTYNESQPMSHPLKATIYAQVRELGGRAVTAVQHKILFPSDTALGIKLEKKEGESELNVHTVAIGSDMNLSDLPKVTVSLEQRLWHYSVRRLRGFNEPYWDYSFNVIEQKEVELNEGKGHIALNLPRYGSFRVRVHSKDTSQYATQSFYNYGNRISFSNAAEPELINLSLDKKSYELGDVAELVVESPFDGRAVIVLQNRDIQDVHTIAIHNGKGTLQIPVGANDVPNLWVRATVIHEVSDSPTETYPYSSYKAISVPVYNKARELSVELIDVPDKIRPDEPFEVRVRTADHQHKPVSAEVTLALVDEGIHSIKGYVNPDPYAWFQRAKRSLFNRAHYYDQVAYTFETSPIGGDQIRKRLASPPNVEDNWIKPVALWSGIVHTDTEGNATVPFDIPDTFNGELRLVAVAVTAKASGAQVTSFKSSLPYIVKYNIPRFTRSGDHFTASLNLFNRTEDACTAVVRWRATKGIIKGQGKTHVELPAMGEGLHTMDFESTNTTGAETIQWDIDILDQGSQVIETLKVSAQLPVRPSTAFQSHHELLILNPGKEVTIKNALFQENELAASTLEISALPTMQLKNPLRYIYTYPYGCVEQTTSRVLPMYMLQHMLLEDTNFGYDRQFVQHRVEQAVERLFSMQTSNGGLAYWPGGHRPYAYSSAYAGHFLTLAYLDPEIEVPELSYKRLLGYLRQVANDSSHKHAHGKLTRAYATFVLALSGDTKIIEQIDRFDHVEMPLTARYYLAWAKTLSGASKEKIEAYLQDAPIMDNGDTYYRNSFASKQRDHSIELMMRLNVDADDPEIHKIASSLLRQLDKGSQFNTHQTAFISSALGQYMNQFTSDSSKANLQIYTENESSSLSGAVTKKLHHEGAGARFLLKNTGEAPIFINHTSQGIPLNPSTKAISEGIKITRYIDGPVKVFRHGETYPVKLTFELDEDIDYLVLADLLPAGFEIENTRLDENALMAAKGTKSIQVRPNFMEIRDDRLVLSYNRLAKGRHTFEYAIRAVTPGSFQYPAAHAEAMYNAALRGSTASDSIEVTKP